MTAMIDPETLFAELTKDADPRVKTSFDHIKESCTDIINVGGRLNYSTVGKWCEEKFCTRSKDGGILKPGQPSVKTIQQNRFNYKAYIDSRKSMTSFGDSGLKKITRIGEQDDYPSPNLDHAAKLHINNLRSEIKKLKKDLKIVEGRFSEMQKDTPIELERLLSYAATRQEGVPIESLMLSDEPSQIISDEAKDALHYLLFELNQTGIVKRMPQDQSQPQSTWVNVVTNKPIISVAQYLALRDFWETIK